MLVWGLNDIIKGYSRDFNEFIEDNKSSGIHYAPRRHTFGVRTDNKKWINRYGAIRVRHTGLLATTKKCYFAFNLFRSETFKEMDINSTYWSASEMK